MFSCFKEADRKSDEEDDFFSQDMEQPLNEDESLTGLKSPSPKSSNRTPICFILNPNSGGKKGTSLLKLINGRYKSMVFDLSLFADRELNLSDPLCMRLKEVLEIPGVRIIIGGGDGSVNWVFHILEIIGIPQPWPPAALLPLGVGNELSRCVGWDAYFNSFFQSDETLLRQRIKQTQNGRILHLDRWKINFIDLDKSKSSKEKNFEEISDANDKVKKTMMCFFSIGFDAKIAYNFDVLRNTSPKLTRTRDLDKFWYTLYGMQQLIQPFPRVKSFMELEVDGKKIELPEEIRTLQVFNIHSSGDGVDFFGTTQSSNTSDHLQDYIHPSLNDGLLEVVGTESVSHLIATRLQFTHSRRIAQGKDIKITIRNPNPVLNQYHSFDDIEALESNDAMKIDAEDYSKKVPCQLDGEAWLLKFPMTIHIKHHSKVNLIQGEGTTRCIQSNHVNKNQ